MAVTATLLVDGSDAPRVRQTLTGYEADATYRVNTSDHEAALSASGLPAIGAAHPTYSSLKVSQRESQYFAGTNDGGSEGGLSKVKLTYSAAGARGTTGHPITPAAGSGYSLIEPGVQTVTVYEAINETTGARIAGSTQLLNGEGYPKEGIAVVVKIVRFYDPVATPMATLITGWLGMAATVNNASVTAPALLGIGPSMTYGAGQLRYRATTYAREGDLISVTHELVASFTDHKVRWRKVDSTGLVATADQVDAVYQKVTWAAM